MKPQTYIKKIIPMILFLAFLPASPVKAVRQNEMIIAVDWGNVPFMYEDNKKVEGIYPALIAAVFDRMGVAVKIKAYPWKRALKLAKKGEIGIGGLYKIKERLKFLDYSDPLYTEKIMIYTKKKKQFKFNTIQDLNKKTIGVIRGWSYGDKVDTFMKSGNVIIKAGDNDTVTFKRLVHDHVDCLFAPEQTGRLMIKQKGYETIIIALPKPIIVKNTYLAFAKTSNRKELLLKFNETLSEMKKDGTYQQVINTVLHKDLKSFPAIRNSKTIQTNKIKSTEECKSAQNRTGCINRSDLNQAIISANML